MISITKDIYSDVNANGSADENDFYGFCSNASSNTNAFLWSFNKKIIEASDDGLEVVYKDEKTTQIVEKIVNMYKNNVGISYITSYKDSEGNYEWPYARDMFSFSKCVFAAGILSYSLENFRDMTDDYSIIPYPKWDENQDNYYSMVDGSHSGLAIPKTATDTEFIGIITEALNAESYKLVVPAYYDVALKVKGTRDEESIEILDMLVANRLFDMGYIYDNWKGASFIIQRLVQSGNTNFESYWASNESAIMAHYQEVIKMFSNN